MIYSYNSLYILFRFDIVRWNWTQLALCSWCWVNLQLFKKCWGLTVDVWNVLECDIRWESGWNKEWVEQIKRKIHLSIYQCLNLLLSIYKKELLKGKKSVLRSGHQTNMAAHHTNTKEETLLVHLLYLKQHTHKPDC